MNRMYFLTKPFVSFVIVTIISLVPTPGFITLTIPDDDSDSQNITIPDSPHVGKRTLSESPLQIYALVQSNGKSSVGIETEDDVFFSQDRYAPASEDNYFTIRAPPSA